MVNDVLDQIAGVLNYRLIYMRIYPTGYYIYSMDNQLHPISIPVGYINSYTPWGSFTKMDEL